MLESLLKGLSFISGFNLRYRYGINELLTTTAEYGSISVVAVDKEGDTKLRIEPIPNATEICRNKSIIKSVYRYNIIVITYDTIVRQSSLTTAT